MLGTLTPTKWPPLEAGRASMPLANPYLGAHGLLANAFPRSTGEALGHELVLPQRLARSDHLGSEAPGEALRVPVGAAGVAQYEGRVPQEAEGQQSERCPSLLLMTVITKLVVASAGAAAGRCRSAVATRTVRVRGTAFRGPPLLMPT